MSETGTDPAADLIRAVVTNLTHAPENWQSLAIVVELGGGRVSGTSGYTYAPDGTSEPTSARPSRIIPAVEAYLDDRYEPGQPRPVAMLVQLDRDASAYEITFEDDDIRRWKVTPANIDEMPEKVRPHLG
ncbi:hypothetical protein GCM10023340_39450 [Nocardioides marinquilinus]|uniref:DUF600 family protein n=1 Tax=Nocardioides marinquilinus TaxID=1210400 RepID=A0ABP9Q1J1_9ACTN